MIQLQVEDAENEIRIILANRHTFLWEQFTESDVILSVQFLCIIYRWNSRDPRGRWNKPTIITGRLVARRGTFHASANSSLQERQSHCCQIQLVPDDAPVISASHWILHQSPGDPPFVKFHSRTNRGSGGTAPSKFTRNMSGQMNLLMCFVATISNGKF